LGCTPSSKQNRILLIGWDAADWRVIHPLIDEGKMPALERLVNRGVMGNLTTLHPVLSPMLWTSIATGKRPYEHGVLGFVEPTPNGQAVRPVSGTSRKVKALWNILSQEGYRSNVIGWWPSHPAEPIRGSMVSNFYHRAVGPLEKPWPMAPGTVQPPELAEPLAEQRFHPQEVMADQIEFFIPKYADIDMEKDRRLSSCMKTLAEATSVHGATTWLMATHEWDLTAVYYDAIDHFCHGFMRYHPPRRSFVSERDFALYSGVVEAAYRFHDMMLHTLLEIAGEDTTVILVSDHGFHPDERRPDGIPQEPAGPAVEHRDFGIFVMAGPGIKHDVTVYGANLLDVTPTVLTAMGLPVGEDMDGKPLVEAFEAPRRIEAIPSWDTREGESGGHAPEEQLDPIAAKEAMDQLVALGYVDPPQGDARDQVTRVTRELQYNLARSYMNGSRFSDAMAILERLYADTPGELRYGAQLAVCYQAQGCIPEFRRLVEDLNERRTRGAAEARERLRELRKTAKQRKAKRAAQAAEAEESAGDEALYTDEERQELRKLRAVAKLKPAALDYFMGLVHLAEGAETEAIECLERAAEADPKRPGLHLQIGEAYVGLGRWKEALEAFQRAGEIDDENAHVHCGLARVYLARHQNRKAAEAALRAIGLLYHYPAAHFTLGVALQRKGRVSQAVQALQVAIAINPNYAAAHERLATLYDERPAQPEKAAEQRRIAAEIRSGERGPGIRQPLVGDADRPLAESVSRRAEAEELPDEAEPFVTIVSGLPRSGTSLMMRMLEAAGLEVMTDSARGADEDNPNGYYELEAVKRTKQDASWLDGAEGKAAKVIHMLLPQLPRDRRYRVLMMRRDMDEVVRSQAEMLARSRKRGGRLNAAEMKAAFRKQLRRVEAFLERHPAFSRLNVDYNALLVNPETELLRVARFLGLTCPTQVMSKVIDARLHRQRSPASSPEAAASVAHNG
jgi:predicted AlkP superfamily phosphohydrolase/phosphomutase/tetratricopeptide (TPR) repeat protein